MMYMGLWLKTAVDSIFWNVAIILFHFALDVLTNVDFAPVLYTPHGFFISYLATFTYVFNVHRSEIKRKEAEGYETPGFRFKPM